MLIFFLSIISHVNLYPSSLFSSTNLNQSVTPLHSLCISWTVHEDVLSLGSPGSLLDLRKTEYQVWVLGLLQDFDLLMSRADCVWLTLYSFESLASNPILLNVIDDAKNNCRETRSAEFASKDFRSLEDSQPLQYSLPGSLSCHPHLRVSLTCSTNSNCKEDNLRFLILGQRESK